MGHMLQNCTVSLNQNVGRSLDVLLWRLLPFNGVILSFILMETESTTAKVFLVKGIILIVIHMKLNCDYL